MYETLCTAHKYADLVKDTPSLKGLTIKVPTSCIRALIMESMTWIKEHHQSMQYA